jgi:hypothetical protein
VDGGGDHLVDLGGRRGPGVPDDDVRATGIVDRVALAAQGSVTGEATDFDGRMRGR